MQVYEPDIARNSMFFYEQGFHVHVASIIWSHLRFGGDVAAARIAGRFEQMGDGWAFSKGNEFRDSLHRI